MKSLPLKKILLYYSTVASLFLTLSGFISVKEIKNASFQLIFLPITMYLFLSASQEIKANLRGEATPDETGPSGKKKKGVIMFFSILFLILISIGTLNLVQPNSLNNKPTPPPAQNSTPLIFENPDTEPETEPENEEVINSSEKSIE